MTDWAFLRRIGRVNIDYRYASDGGFIVNELPELIETPRTMSMSLSPGSDRCPLSDATEIFQGNQRRGVFGFHDKFLRDAMISIALKPGAHDQKVSSDTFWHYRCHNSEDLIEVHQVWFGSYRSSHQRMFRP